jgi:hypothetical protein
VKAGAFVPGVSTVFAPASAPRDARAVFAAAGVRVRSFFMPLVLHIVLGNSVSELGEQT